MGPPLIRKVELDVMKDSEYLVRSLDSLSCPVLLITTSDIGTLLPELTAVAKEYPIVVREHEGKWDPASVECVRRVFGMGVSRRIARGETRVVTR